MAKYLLDNRLAPLTFCWGFVEKPLAAVGECVNAWHKKNFRSVHTESVDAPLAEALRKLEPLIEPRAELMLATDSRWTVYFGNGRRGGGAAFWLSYVCRVMSCRGIAVTCSPSTRLTRDKNVKGVQGAVQFTLVAAEERAFLNFERSIAVGNDCGSWDFVANGAPLPFEQTAQYSAQRVADRFTPEMLEAYCGEYGIRLFDPTFYGPTGILEKILDRRRSNFRPRTLEDVQQEMGPLPGG